MKHRQLWRLLAAALALSAASLQAQPARNEAAPPAYGPGMMGNYGPGMMGPGRGGMMGLGPLQAIDLSEQQLTRINQIRDEQRRKDWIVMGKLQDERAQMRDLFLAEKRDPATIGRQSMKIAELQRQLLEAQVDTHNRIEALLSKEQKEQLRSYHRGWMMDAPD